MTENNPSPGISDSASVRDRLIDALHLDLIGPRPEDELLQHEHLSIPPSRKYLTGFLVPASAPDTQRARDTEEDLDDPAESSQGGDDATTPEPGNSKRMFLPSSMGLSLLLDASTSRLDLELFWGDYVLKDSSGDGGVLSETKANIEDDSNDASIPRRVISWVRRPQHETVSIDLASVQVERPKPFAVPRSEGIEVVCLSRGTKILDEQPEQSREALAVSVFVVNRRNAIDDDERQDAAFAFQVEMNVVADGNVIPRFDSTSVGKNEWDDRLADLHYRDSAEFAVGHNISVRTESIGDECRKVRTEWMPVATVEHVHPSTITDVEFGMEVLGALHDADEAKRLLNPLVCAYREWIDSQRNKAQLFTGRRKEIAENLAGRAETAAKRVQEGIDILDDPDVREAFCIANRAMTAAARRRISQEIGCDPSAVDPPRWHPFQLAFILLNLRSIAEPSHVQRKIVDLLFFPTGGGKTEAYLGLAAFTLVLRRLRDPDPVHRGLSVLMRYTLRLLTLDQLGRAAALVCALELEREKMEERLGSWPFEIALWVGSGATPNYMGGKGDSSEATARAKVMRFARDTSRSPPLPLDKCPWCGAKFGKSSFRLEPNADTPVNLLVMCADRDCDFSGRSRHLPVVAVDEPIYERLPAFMIATADKFAAMPWVGDTANFFRGGSPDEPRPPDLIIQDELHLISGPLGTMAGLYETAINHLCRREVDGKSVYPKIIASTATVRLAEKQVRALFARQSVQVFPPPGIDRRDSFFAQQMPKQKMEPRTYLGIAAQGRGPKVMFLRSMITLMAAAQAAWNAAASDDGSNPADPYMTVVAYFNALRELGSARRIVEDEIGLRLQNYASQTHQNKSIELFADRKIGFEPVELTSRVSTAAVAEAKRRLSLDFAQAEKVDVALATNMISVGLDITRLGLMFVSGQPKTTAEYIQATSRVGRDPGRPGLVITLLNIHRPRDRSHYEHFSAWHESFYRNVEPTSVTPFSRRALDRGLAAVTVALARLGIPGLTPLDAAGDVEHFIGKKTEELAHEVAVRAQGHRDGLPADFGKRTADRVKSIIDEWAKLAHRVKQDGLKFGYALRRRDSSVSVPLLREMIDPNNDKLDKSQLVFRSPRSLRDVEPNVLLGIKTPDGRDISKGNSAAENILRQSQLITTYGPGAMVDLPDHSVIVSDLRGWTLHCAEKIDEPRLVYKLRRLQRNPSIKLYTPPRHDENTSRRSEVGALIFPTWFIVKKADPSPRSSQWRRRRMVRWMHLEVDKGKFRNQDGRNESVVPVRFVCGCRRGHIDDLDWRRFVHRKSGKPCSQPMWLEERGTGADIRDTYGVCECGEERSLYEAASYNTDALGRCEGKRPWIGSHAREACHEPYRLLVRTASNAYFPQTICVISLPESDEGLADLVTRYYEQIKQTEYVGALAKFRLVPELDAAFSDFSDESVLAEYHRIKGGGEQPDIPVKAAEFAILNRGETFIGEDDPRSKFYAETLVRGEWDDGKDARLAVIDRLVLVHRLREVIALLGFTRFDAISPDKDGELDSDVTTAQLADDLKWLPATENRGEGVFLSFKSKEMKKWLARPNVQQREKQLEEGWEAWGRQHPWSKSEFPGSAYVMLHSLSHMLMTEIALDCGYPASALRERVYASEGNYGILIYTGSSDSEGTLGGLVEAGRRFPEYLRRALGNGRLCSNDPVCSEHAPDSHLEGRQLHGAACHGCLLVSETSCEQRNDFLDRALVVPTVSVSTAAFFSAG